ncbi:VOC family protein [Plantactinospora sp. B5E13]|uniref:VOC family protein n=1 Tax=unclassified Plantactinospora TaxID=2631981 RepID=UPI00325D0FBD
MAAFVSQYTLDVRDVDLMARFWSRALGYRCVPKDDGSVKLCPPDGAPPTVPSVWLQPTAPVKAGKNRLHLDLAVRDGVAADEVARLIGLGARRADVGQRGDEPFVVLADPEGNEFCLLDHPTRGG